jgi:hypothetical protein
MLYFHYRDTITLGGYIERTADVGDRGGGALRAEMGRARHVITEEKGDTHENLTRLHHRLKY